VQCAPREHEKCPDYSGVLIFQGFPTQYYVIHMYKFGTIT
jgi:hypothetical protein